MTGKTSTKTAETITDFGNRQLNKQNFSRTVVLPKTALKNCGCNPDDDCKVNVSLVQNKDERVLKITPIAPNDADLDENEEEEKNE